MKNISNKWVLAIVFIIVIGIGGFVIYSSQSQKTDTVAQTAGANPTFIKTLKSTDGSTLGDLYLTFISDKRDMFSSLYVVKQVQGQDTIVFKADEAGLFNTQGRLVGPVDNFYAYSISAISDDSFTLFGVGNQGKNKTANMTIVWDKTEQAFEVVGIPVLH